MLFYRFLFFAKFGFAFFFWMSLRKKSWRTFFPKLILKCLFLMLYLRIFRNGKKNAEIGTVWGVSYLPTVLVKPPNSWNGPDGLFSHVAGRPPLTLCKREWVEKKISKACGKVISIPRTYVNCVSVPPKVANLFLLLVSVVFRALRPSLPRNFCSILVY